MAKPRAAVLKRRVTKRNRNKPTKLKWRVFLRKEVTHASVPFPPDYLR